MLGFTLFVLFMIGWILWVSRNADVEGARYDEAVAAHKTGAVMIEDDIDYTDASYLERDEDWTEADQEAENRHIKWVGLAADPNHER